MDAIEIVDRLRTYRENAGFPREIVQEAIAKQSEVTPLLLQALEEAAADVEAIGPDDILHIYAMYLLAQFREVRAYPILIKFFSASGEAAADSVGDLLTEDLCRILASVCGGDLGPIQALAENEEVDEFVRSAALEALVVVVAAEMHPRSVVLEYFNGLFAGGLKREPGFVWSGLVLSCCDLNSRDWLKQIEQAYEDELVDETVLTFEEVEESAEPSVEETLQTLRGELTLIFDTVAEMEWWDCFKPAEEGAGGDAQPETGAQTVGRNDPCPCGSEKKYKKCCGQPA